jgi:uncharacterized membrane protein
MFILGILAVVVLAALVVTKYFTSSRIQDKKQVIAETEKGIRKYRGDLKLAQNSKAAAEIDLKEEGKKKQTLETQIQRFDQQLAKMRR